MNETPPISSTEQPQEDTSSLFERFMAKMKASGEGARDLTEILQQKKNPSPSNGTQTEIKPSTELIIGEKRADLGEVLLVPDEKKEVQQKSEPSQKPSEWDAPGERTEQVPTAGARAGQKESDEGIAIDLGTTEQRIKQEHAPGEGSGPVDLDASLILETHEIEEEEKEERKKPTISKQPEKKEFKYDIEVPDPGDIGTIRFVIQMLIDLYLLRYPGDRDGVLPLDRKDRRVILELEDLFEETCVKEKNISEEKFDALVDEWLQYREKNPLLVEPVKPIIEKVTTLEALYELLSESERHEMELNIQWIEQEAQENRATESDADEEPEMAKKISEDRIIIKVVAEVYTPHVIFGLPLTLIRSLTRVISEARAFEKAEPEKKLKGKRAQYNGRRKRVYEELLTDLSKIFNRQLDDSKVGMELSKVQDVGTLLEGRIEEIQEKIRIVSQEIEEKRRMEDEQESLSKLLGKKERLIRTLDILIGKRDNLCSALRKAFTDIIRPS